MEEGTSGRGFLGSGIINGMVKVKIHGKPAETMKEAQNSAAYEAIKYLKRQFSMEVIDVSYEEMVEYKTKYFEMKEKLERLKEKHQKLKEDYAKLT